MNQGCMYRDYCSDESCKYMLYDNCERYRKFLLNEKIRDIRGKFTYDANALKIKPGIKRGFSFQKDLLCSYIMCECLRNLTSMRIKYWSDVINEVFNVGIDYENIYNKREILLLVYDDTLDYYLNSEKKLSYIYGIKKFLSLYPYPVFFLFLLDNMAKKKLENGSENVSKHDVLSRKKSILLKRFRNVNNSIEYDSFMDMNDDFRRMFVHERFIDIDKEIFCIFPELKRIMLGMCMDNNNKETDYKKQSIPEDKVEEKKEIDDKSYEFQNDIKSKDTDTDKNEHNNEKGNDSVNVEAVHSRMMPAKQVKTKKSKTTQNIKRR